MTKHNQLPKSTWRRGDGISVSVNVLCNAQSRQKKKKKGGQVRYTEQGKGYSGQGDFPFLSESIVSQPLYPQGQS